MECPPLQRCGGRSLEVSRTCLSGEVGNCLVEVDSRPLSPSCCRHFPGAQPRGLCKTEYLALLASTGLFCASKTDIRPCERILSHPCTCYQPPPRPVPALPTREGRCRGETCLGCLLSPVYCLLLDYLSFIAVASFCFLCTLKRVFCQKCESQIYFLFCWSIISYFLQPVSAPEGNHCNQKAITALQQFTFKSVNPRRVCHLRISQGFCC